jgi:3-dehydroquinate dehydratase-1
MMSKLYKKIGPQVVGVVSDAQSLAEALRLQKGQVGFLEMRLDLLMKGDVLQSAWNAVRYLQIPLIITVRDAGEGGLAIRLHERKELYLKWMEYAHMVDIEVSTMGVMESVLHEAKKQDVHIVGSLHQMSGCKQPCFSRRRAESSLQVANHYGIDIFKLAAEVDHRGFTEMLKMLEGSNGTPLSIMCVGEYGKVSRVTFPMFGSFLNYGYLGQSPVVGGQFHALRLKEIIDEMSPYAVQLAALQEVATGTSD